jgi:hypothetical protein
MAEVWCIVSDANEESRNLVELLVQERHQVAVIAPDVAPLALLVNTYADALLPIELTSPDLLSLTDAQWSVEENFGAVDVIALVGQAGHARDGQDDSEGHDDSESGTWARAARDFFAARWPDAEVVVVTPAGRP